VSFPQYPSYKDSGVEWLGKVPAHWAIDRIKRSTVACRNGIWGNEPQQDENDIPCIRVADFDRQKLRVELSEPTIRNVTQNEREGRIVNQGDLLLEKSGGGETQPVGCVVLYDDPHAAVCSNFVARVQVAKEMSSSFWRYVHAATYAVRLNTRSIKQTSGIQNLDSSQYFDERAGFPPFAEQTRIAEFLDRETGKIDELVAEQRRLMELLKEKRQAVISHAVTRGLNPAVPLKPSGIEWLGDVPAHWSVMPLKRACRIESGHTPQKSNEAYWVPEDSCIPWISLNDTKTLDASDFIDDTVVKISELGMHNSSAHLIEAGAVVMNRDGARVGLAAITTKPMCVSQHIIAWVCGTSVFNHYLLHVLYAMNDEIYRLAGGATIPTIGMPDIREMTMPLPPLNEQNAIVDYLLDQRHRLDTLTAEAQRAIDLLQERRTALISAAVTGQIDVRPLAAKKTA
jgi:type I restriction enzyme S subunit